MKVKSICLSIILLLVTTFSYSQSADEVIKGKWKVKVDDKIGTLTIEKTIPKDKSNEWKLEGYLEMNSIANTKIKIRGTIKMSARRDFFRATVKIKVADKLSFPGSHSFDLAVGTNKKFMAGTSSDYLPVVAEKM